MITQNGESSRDLLLSVANRKALAQGGGVGWGGRLGVFIGFYESESSNFVYTLRVAEYIVGKNLKMLRLIFAFFLHFSFFPSLTPM